MNALEFLKEKKNLFILLIASFVLHFWNFGFPKEVAFDEVLIGSFAANYFHGTYYFDIHPPHLKLIYAALAYLGGFSGHFPAVEQSYDGSYYLWMRFLPAFCGSLIPLWVYGLARLAKTSVPVSLGVAMLSLLDGVLLVESHFILNDAVLLHFGLLGNYGFFKYLMQPPSKNSKKWFVAGCLSLALASSVKWTGLGFLIPPFLGLLFLWVGRRLSFKKTAQSALTLLFIVFVWQWAGYAIHFKLLPYHGSGEGFMSPAFNQRLVNPGQIKSSETMGDMQATLELNEAMARYSSQVLPHPYGSPWFSWPVGWRGIYVWNDRQTPETSRIYMLPNLVVWWASGLAMLYGMMNAIPVGVARLLKRKTVQVWEPLDYFLIACFILNMIPFIGINRVMFIYHFIPSLAIEIIFLARVLQRIDRPKPFIIALLTMAFIMFIWMFPLTFGLPMSNEALQWRMIFPSWP